MRQQRLPPARLQHAAVKGLLCVLLAGGGSRTSGRRSGGRRGRQASHDTLNNLNEERRMVRQGGVLNLPKRETGAEALAMRDGEMLWDGMHIIL